MCVGGRVWECEGWAWCGLTLEGPCRPGMHRGMPWRGGTLSVLAPVADLVNHRAPKGGGARLHVPSRATDEGDTGGPGWSQGLWGRSNPQGQPVFELIAGSNSSRGQLTNTPPYLSVCTRNAATQHPACPVPSVFVLFVCVCKTWAGGGILPCVESCHVLKGFEKLMNTQLMNK